MRKPTREQLIRQLHEINKQLDQLDADQSDDDRLDATQGKPQSDPALDVKTTLEHHIDHSPLAVVQWDRQFVVRRWSGRAQSIFGWPAEEVIGKRWDKFHFVHEDDMHRVLTVGNELIEGRANYNTCMNRNYRKDGSVVHCEWFNSVRRDDDGNLNSWLSLVHDVTDRIRAQDESQRARSAMRLVIEGTTHVTGNQFYQSLVGHLAEALNVRYVLLGRLDADGQQAKTLAFWSGSQLADNLQFQLEGTPCKDVIAGSTKIFRSGIQQRFPDHSLLRKMNAESYAGTPLVSSSGQVMGLLAALDDRPLDDRPELTEILEMFGNRAAAEIERVATEKAMHESRAILTAAIEASPAGIIIADAPDVRIRSVNSAALGIRDAPLEMLTDIPFDLHPSRWQCSHPDGTPYAPEDLPLSKAVLEGVVSTNVDVIIEHGGGEKHWVLGNAAPVRNAEGELVAGVVVFPDVTDQKRAEESLRRMESELAHVDRVSTMGEMVGGVAHELNQPLYAIQNFAKACRNVLNRQEVVDRQQLIHWLDQITSTAEFAGEVLLRLRNFVTRVPMNRSPVEIHELIANALALTRHDAFSRGVRIDDQIPATLPVVNADPVQIQQVLVNLLRNAFDATQRQASGPPRITISAATKQAFVEVTVADNGPGLPGKEAKIFEAFRSTKPGGMGLGLAIGKTIIEGHGGTLTGSSPRGGGAVFRFTIPVSL